MRPGERQIIDGRSFKRDTGSSPNGVANAWLAQARGKLVIVEHGNECVAQGQLVAFDAYSIEVLPEGEERSILIFKGPGLIVSAP